MMSNGGYAEAYDVRRSGRISASAALGGGGGRSGRYGSTSTLPSDLLLALLLSKSLLALSLHILSSWNSSFETWTTNAVALGVAAGVLGGWERAGEGGGGGGRGMKSRKEPSSPLYPFLFAFESLSALLCISHLSVLRFLLLTSFSSLWARGLPFLKTGGKKAVVKSVSGAGPSNALFMTLAMVGFSYAVDLTMSSGVTRTGYVYLLLHLVASGQRNEIFSTYNGDDRAKGKMHANGVLVAAVIAGVGAFGKSAFFSSTPVAAAAAAATSSTASSAFFASPAPSFPLKLLSVALFSSTYLLIDPLLTRALLAHFPPVKVLRAGWPLAVGSAAFVGYVGFGKGVGVGEGAVGVVAWNAISHISASDPRSSFVSTSSSSSVSTGHSSSSAPLPLLQRLATFYRHLRATIKTILLNPESRKIYFFLCLNLAFMFVQMAYGIWTNSLGLISDSIHMFFDCLALAMGLFASVMANWPSNEIYTYGYSRVETLSGFANGLFLCLISIFIVFEAIQRLIDPPEMNTGQLLTVSSVGLAVNLVGMAATGGHHGHSHGGGGGGGHSHGHSHAPVKSKSTPFLVEKGEEEDDHHDHSHNGSAASHSSHSHAVAATPPRPPPAPSTPHSSHSHSHAPSHSDSPSHSHAAPSPSPAASHSSHSHGNGASHASHDECEEDDEDEHVAHNGGSHNMKGVFLHVLADTLGSVGVIISTLLINRYGWNGFDPLASIFIAVLIFASVVPLVVDSGKLLVLDMGEEKEAEVRKALTAVNRLEGVASFTKPRFWQKDPSSMVGSICIQLSPAPGYTPSSSQSHSHSHSHNPADKPRYFANIEKTTARVRRALRANIGGLENVVIQVEPTGGFGELGGGERSRAGIANGA